MRLFISFLTIFPCVIFNATPLEQVLKVDGNYFLTIKIGLQVIDMLREGNFLILSVTFLQQFEHGFINFMRA